jgi:hypothetical protein
MKTKLRPSDQGSVLKLLLVLMMLGLAMVVPVGAMIYLSVRTNSDFRTVQDIVLKELPQRPNLWVSVRAPSILVSLAQFGLSFVNDIDVEARLAMESVHGGQVGVYQLPQPVSPANKIRIMNRVDAALSQNKWSRVVAVVERDEMVLVYAPDVLDDPDDLEVLTLVLSNNELVLVSAKGDLRPVYQIARSHFDEASKERRHAFD